MGSSADGKGHNRRREYDPTVDQSTSGGLLDAHQYPEFWFLQKWGVPPDESSRDPRTSAILSRLYKVWPRLTPDQRRLYLQTAERIAEAEKAKGAWNPKASRKRSIRLIKSAVASAKLVHIELEFNFSATLGRRREGKIGELVFGLASFIAGTLSATFPWDRDIAVDTASDALRSAKKKIARKTGGMRWELLRDLVWLASGKRDLDERTVRRYLDKRPIAKNPLEAYWQPHMELIGAGIRLARQWRAHQDEPGKPYRPKPLLEEPGGYLLESKQFERAGLNYVRTACVSDTSQGNPAQTREIVADSCLDLKGSQTV